MQVDLEESDLPRFVGGGYIGVLVAACKHVRSTGGAFAVICDEGPALPFFRFRDSSTTSA